MFERLWWFTSDHKPSITTNMGFSPVTHFKFEDTKGVIRNSNSKNRQYNGQKKENKGTSPIHHTVAKALL